MEMKWHPIEDGDLSRVQEFGNTLFTIIDEDTDELYVIFDEICRTYVEARIVVFYNYGTLSSSEKVIAWMDVPEPYNPKADAIKVFLTDDEQNEVLKAMKETGKFVSEVKY